MSRPPPDIVTLIKPRFEALAGYTRTPNIIAVVEEMEWFSTRDERLLGLVTEDRIDHDFGWVILGRDERRRFRAIDAGTYHQTAERSRLDLMAKLAEHHAAPDDSFFQGDDPLPPVDFFTPQVEASRFHSTFKSLLDVTK